MKTMICALLLATPILAAQIDIDDGSVYTDKPARLMFKQGTFSVESEDEKFDIPSYNVRGSVKGLCDDAIESLLSSGDVYFRLNYENKTLDSNLRMRGGGGSSSKATVDAGLAAGGHRTTSDWTSQGQHRSPGQWLSQGNHRTPGEWLSGVKSKNKK